MVSKESEYLIHIAEEQLERLNKSLYYYQKNSEMESDILSSSISLNQSNNFKCNSSHTTNYSNNDYQMTNELKPIYNLIRKQRHESITGSTIIKNNINTEKRKPFKSTNNDHIRDWRNGVNLVKKTLGPNNKTGRKSPTSKSQSVSPNCTKKRERVSTFWNDRDCKRKSKSPSKEITIKSDRTTIDNGCTKRNLNDKGDIQKYMKYKQKLAKEKRYEADLTMKSRKENIKSSLNNLQNYQHDRFSHFKSSKQSNNRFQSDNFHMKSNSMSSLQKSKLPTPIYDELEKDGLLEYIDLSNYDQPFLINVSSKYRNGLNSTVDSGIETGEWFRSLTPDKFRQSYERIDEHNWSLPPPLPKMSTSLSQTDLKRDKSHNDEKFKGRYQNKYKQIYQEQISAYDASSENEVAQESDDGKRTSPSMVSSNNTADLLMNHLNQYLNTMKMSNEEFSHSQKPMPNKKLSDGIDMVDKSTVDTIQLDNSRGCIIQDLKDALYNAQMELDVDNRDSNENLSEKISQAVQNFIKVISNTKESISVSTRPSTCLSPSQNSAEIKIEALPKTPLRYETKIIKKQDKKDFPTELETTEIDSEVKKNLTANHIYNTLETNNEIIKISDESSKEILCDNANLSLIDINEEIPSITAYKQELQSRQDKAYDLIKLTKNLQKESQRVILLEKKAFEISKRFIPNIKSDNSNTFQSKLEPVYGHKSLTEDLNFIKNQENTKSKDNIDSNKSTEYKKKIKMINLQLQPTDSNYESSHSDKGSHSQSSQSENDEITISISEITTTLTDQSELEARLLALESEMKKKKELVNILKKRQKELKRDKIKQKEIVLQKQIEMYDTYIDKLQVSVDQLNNKLDDNISDDSHTLTGSNSNLNDLDVKSESIDNQFILNGQDLFNSIFKSQPNKEENNLPDNVPDFSGDTEDISNDQVNNLKSMCFKGSLDSLIENNQDIAIGDTDIEALYQKEKRNNRTMSNIESDNIFLIQEDICDIKQENIKENDVYYIDKPDLSTNIEICLLDSKESNPKDTLFPLIYDNSFDIPVNFVNREEVNEYNRIDNSLIIFDKNETVNNWDDLVQRNTIDDGLSTINIIDELYQKEKNCEDGNINELLDQLIIFNDGLTMQNSVKCDPSKIEITDLLLPQSKDDYVEKENIKHSQNIDNDINLITNLDDNSEPNDSIEIMKGDLLTHSEISSNSSSIVSRTSISDKIKDNKDNNIEICLPNIIDDEINMKTIIQYAETISNDGSSNSDIDSIANCIEEDSLEDSNIRKLTPRNFETDLQSTENVMVTTPIPQSYELENHTNTDNVIENEKINKFSEEILNSVHIEELVDTLLNTIILSEIKCFTPVLAKIEKEKPQLLTAVTVSDYLSTSFIEDSVELLSPINEKKAFSNSVLQSHDLWDLSDLTVEDIWKVDIPTTVTHDVIDTELHITPPVALIDKELLTEKVSWLIPLKSEHIDPLVESAIHHFYESRKKRSGETLNALLDAQNTLPHLYYNSNPVVTEKEIGSLFETSVHQPYIDKRIIFNIILEVFLEIYSFEKHLPQPSWIHSSFMVKNNVYTLWKGDKPPESYDLVRKIVQEHVELLINQKTILQSGYQLSYKDSDNQSKIVRWCIRQQKDDVDKLLITDLRKEENDWIYYDEAEEEVKFQIAEEIFNILFSDTISWLKSIPNPN